MHRLIATLLSSCVALFALAHVVTAQERTVTGTVTDAVTDQPLPGVNVVLDGTTRGTTTTTDRNYNIRVDGSEDVLVFSFVGYVTHREQVEDREVIDVSLQEDVALLEDIVVVGYGQRRRADVTGSVSSVDVEAANVGQVVNPDQLIQGRVAGVNITPSDGSPGASSLIRIRGATSISASSEPLFVIDGVPVDNSPTEPGGASVSQAPPRNPLNMLNANDIESIDILKDASAAAIYGSRGANGVILITTKQGRAGQVTVDYDGSVSASGLANRVDLLTGPEFRQFAESVGSNIMDFGVDTDWQDAMTRTAVSHSHNLAISGGTEQTQYRASVGYMLEEGIVVNSGLERVTGRVNANHNALEGRLRIGLNLTASHVQDENLPYQQTGGFEGGFFTNVMKMPPTVPVRLEDGSFFEFPGTSIRNPIALAEQIQDFTSSTRVLGNLHGELDLFPGLTARVNLGLNRSQGIRRIFVPRANPVGRTVGGEATQRNMDRSSELLEVMGTYRGSFIAGHALEATAGYSFQEFNSEGFGATMRNFISDLFSFDALESGLDNSINPDSFREKNRLVSFFGRVNYDIDDKYLFTGTLRYDGSSRFGADNKWGVFPSASAAWRLSNEPFLADVRGLSNLMIRAGYGITGSQEIGNLRSLPTMAPNPAFRAILGGSEVIGVAPNNFANPNLQWEETASFNVGLDYGFLFGRIRGEVEFYIRDTDNLLVEFDVPQPAVVPTRLENAGSVRNTGLDFSIDALAIDHTNFALSIGANLNTNRNEVRSLGGRERIITGNVSGAGQSGVQSQVIQPGSPLGTFFGPRFVGVNENGQQEFEQLDAEGNVIGTTTDPGGNDRQILGNAQPDFTFGFNTRVDIRNFDISVFLRGAVGHDVFNNTALEYTLQDNVNTGINLLRPALTDGTNLEEQGVFSSRWIEDGSFVRIDNVTVGYTIQNLPQVRNARVYVAANNLHNFTSYNGFDPEVNTEAGLATLGIDYTTYPRARTFTAGISLGF